MGRHKTDPFIQRFGTCWWMELLSHRFIGTKVPFLNSYFGQGIFVLYTETEFLVWYRLVVAWTPSFLGELYLVSDFESFSANSPRHQWYRAVGISSVQMNSTITLANAIPNDPEIEIRTLLAYSQPMSSKRGMSIKLNKYAC